ncbi:UNVERIFIED_CONTAM: hypothetical protein NCL1_23708 [Trichonephila clavipes]
MSEIEMSPTSLYTPSKRGISIRSGARKNILNVYSRLREKNPQETISEIVRKVSELTGVSNRTVFRLKKEKKTLSDLSSVILIELNIYYIYYTLKKEDSSTVDLKDVINSEQECKTPFLPSRFQNEIIKIDFSQYDNLKHHLCAHEIHKPLVFEIHTKSFSQTSNLKAHLQIYTKEKHYF